MTKRSGFTMVELSIVIGIIGLIAAGIIVGRSMFEAAETRAIATEISIYTTSFKEFVDKYQAIPGDMNNAESYWYSDDSCPNTATNSTPKIPTCNGGGNGIIGDWTNTATATAGSEYEWFRAWQHLSNAELIEGQFTGVGGSSSTEALIGLNVPASKTGKGGWTLLYMASDGSTDTAFFNSAVASHVLMYGGQTSGSFTDTPSMTPTHMKSIDEKLDDGLPFTGKLRVKKNTATSCTVSSATTSDYLLTSTAQACQLLFLMGV
ncbi:MAG: prepilin-type N-terminal cleavage/methylation domain-containing protein [Alphaproteobacteria bacterium]|nr:prepilin-type N-terminal cleavage/methylation domain-containing protein [Alphaproteobacteria bacterium]